MSATLPSLLDEPVSDPLPLYRLRDGIAALDLVSAAIVHLDLFTWLAQNPATPAAICQAHEIHTRPADVMITLLKAMGLLTEAGGVLHVSLRAREHLNSASKFNLIPYYAALKDRPQTLDMLKVLKTGKPAKWGSYEGEEWARAMERPEFAAQFTAAMDCRGVILGPALAQKLDLSDHRSLLDIAGGSGIYACAIAARHEAMRVAVLEKPPVDRIARENIQQRGFADRVEVCAGDIIAEVLPTGYDVHLWSNVIHDWDESTVRTLLQKSYEALPRNGLVVIHDAFINREKNGPLHIAEYSALVMNTSEGKCYSVGEISNMLFAANFEVVDQQPTAVGRGFIAARRL